MADTVCVYLNEAGMRLVDGAHSTHIGYHDRWYWLGGLKRYELRDGRVMSEFVQSWEKVGRRVFVFIALKDKNGREVPATLWTEATKRSI